MSDYDIYNKYGEKVGSIESKSGFWPTVFCVIFFLIIIFVCVQCSKDQEQTQKQEAMASDFIRLIDLEKYVEGTNEKIDTKNEQAWIEKEYPDVIISSNHEVRWEKGAASRSEDDSFRYSDEYSFSCSQSGNFGDNYANFLTYKLTDGYEKIEGTVYLSQQAIDDWEWWLENEQYREEHNITNMFGVEHEYKRFGLCVIFADNEVIYKSPILRPNETYSDQISVSIKGSDEIVVCMIGLAYLGAPRVTK